MSRVGVKSLEVCSVVENSSKQSDLTFIGRYMGSFLGDRLHGVGVSGRSLG